MPTLELTLPLPGVSRQALWDFHRDPDTLLTLTPPDLRLSIVERPPVLGQDARIVLRFRRYGIPVTLVSRIEVWEPPRRFVDVEESGPFARWRHEHIFEDGRLVDRLDYEGPLARFGGRIADVLFVRPELDRMFAYRHLVTTAALEGNRERPGNFPRQAGVTPPGDD